MRYDLMKDIDIIHDLAEKIDRIRIRKRLKDKDVEAAGGISRQLLSDFRNGKRSVSLKSFIRLLRGIGELDRLQTLLSDSSDYSPMLGEEKELPKRVRDKNSLDKDFKWGDGE